MNRRRPEVFVVVPAYNEGCVVGATVSGLREAFEHVVVIDDCSRDDTGTAAAACGAAVIRHAANLGQGAAIQTGLSYCLDRNADYAITFDADGQHRPLDALTMFEAVRESGCDVALGSRFKENDFCGIPFGRLVVLKAAVVFTRLTTGLKLTDTHNGLRVFSRKAMEKIEIAQNRMAHASEILWSISECGLRFIEVPVRISYTGYSLAKGQKLSGAIRILADLISARRREGERTATRLVRSCALLERKCFDLVEELERS